MWVAGIEIPKDAVAELASRLQQAGHRGLAQRFQSALESDSERVGLYLNEYALVLAVLVDPAVGLEKLRAGLEKLQAIPPAKPVSLPRNALGEH